MDPVTLRELFIAVAAAVLGWLTRWFQGRFK